MRLVMARGGDQRHGAVAGRQKFERAGFQRQVAVDLGHEGTVPVVLQRRMVKRRQRGADDPGGGGQVDAHKALHEFGPDGVAQGGKGGHAGGHGDGFGVDQRAV